MTVNIYVLGHIYFSRGMAKARYGNRRIDNFFAGNYLLGILNFLLKFIYSLFFCRLSYPQQGDNYEGIVVYGTSRSNRVSIEPLLEEVGKEKMVTMLTEHSFPSWRLYWYAFPHLFDIIKDVRSASGENKKIIKYFFSKFWRMYGCPKVVNQILDKYKPKMVILANDHLPFNHCLRLIANERGIKTIYIQHGIVGLTYPPLQFSYVLLDGMEAFEKYKRIGDVKGRIYLCGGVRFDAIKGINNHEARSLKIGVAFNAVDNIEEVKNLCFYLKQIILNGYPAEVILRPHPLLSGNKWKDWCLKNGISYSASHTESPFEFINKLSCLVANQSSIHLDAAMCRVPSIVYDFSKGGSKDLYGFVKNGLVVEANNFDEIGLFIDNLDNFKINPSVVKYYNSSYGTNYEGHVSSIITCLINSLLNNDNQFDSKCGFSPIEITDNYTLFSSN